MRYHRVQWIESGQVWGDVDETVRVLTLTDAGMEG